jgi:CBS domain-containing protein
MSIVSICQRNVDTARPDETVQAAAQRMATRAVGTLVVVDDLQRPIGMITDRDLALRVIAVGSDPVDTCLRDVMTGHVEVLRDDQSIEDALAAMRAAGVRRLPLVDRSGRLCGIVSLEDVLALLSREMAEIGSFLRRAAPAEIASS